MHRNKFGTEYDTLPGGAIEIGESPQQAALREVTEETGLQVQHPRLVFIDHAGDMYGDQFVFLCEYVGGEPRLSVDSHEYAINQLGENLYDPRWLPLDDLADAPFLSEELKHAILDGVANGWPEETQEFSSKRTI